MVTASDPSRSLLNAHFSLAEAWMLLTCNSTTLRKGCLQADGGQKLTAEEKNPTPPPHNPNSQNPQEMS